MSRIVLEWGGLNGGSHTEYCVKRMYKIQHQSTNVEVVRLGYFGPFDISSSTRICSTRYIADFSQGTWKRNYIILIGLQSSCSISMIHEMNSFMEQRFLWKLDDVLV